MVLFWPEVRYCSTFTNELPSYELSTYVPIPMISTDRTYRVQKWRSKLLPALMAIEDNLFFMNLKVLFQICFLRECLIAPSKLTFKGSLSGVHPQMIEKIVPFPEKHPATDVIAL